MNERILELMIQTMIETGRLEDVQATYQRFAELIVERLCYDMMDVCGATQAERIQFVAKNWGVEL